MAVTGKYTPEPGPPKKGFFGFIASFFPKQPKPSSHLDPQNLSTNSSNVNQSTEPDQFAPGNDPLQRPAPTIKADHDPQPIAVPEGLAAKPVEADGTKVAPTLPTQEPGEGDDASETPRPIPPTDPNRF
jgi:hypothetical protein